MQYMYRISLGVAILHKHSDGEDKGKPKKIGKFKSDELAKVACVYHFENACKMADVASRERPVMFFV